MGIWLDILRLAADGNSGAARELLELKLPIALRDFVFSGAERRKYQGPVPDAVARYISKLSSSEGSLARFREYDLVDYVVDDVVAAVRRTLVLVQVIRARPDSSLDDLVTAFPWDPGLKRAAEWKRARIARLSSSMIAAGIPLPRPAGLAVTEEVEEIYPFDEIAFATSNKRIEQSWWDFKKQQDLDAYYLTIVDSDQRTEVDSEGVDYGSISVAKIVLGTDSGVDHETILDLHLLGREIGPELTNLMEGLHESKPSEGYRPIAWHNVFWCLSSDYEGLHLNLSQVDPFCERDQELSEHIADNYREVVGASRPVIYRRRKTLHAACEQELLVRMRARFASGTTEATDHI